MIEGGVNSQLRAVLRNHRGLTSVKRVKVVFWWCHVRSGDARTASVKLAAMPTDADIDFLFSVCSASPSREDGGGGVERRGRVGGPSPQGPVPLLAGLMDGNGCSIGTHILSYKPQSVSMLGVSAQVVSLFPLLKSSPHFLPLGQISCSCVYRFRW